MSALAGLVKPLEWDFDGRSLRMDDTMVMGKGYDWDGYECLRQEGYGIGSGYIIWPERIVGGQWSLYGTFDGIYVQSIAGEYAAKARAQVDYEARILSALNLPMLTALSDDASKAAELALALQNLANEMRHLLRVNPAKDGGLYRQRLTEADAILEGKP